MNDNYFPQEEMIVTEKEKQEFLDYLPSLVKVDKGIEKAVDIVNRMPYFLTQSSCEGQNPNEPYSTHMPVPYISVGVLYRRFDLLDQLADFFWEELKGKIHSMTLDTQVQKMNIHKETSSVVPNVQKYLSVYMKTKRGISLLEQALEKFSTLPIENTEPNKAIIEMELAKRFRRYAIMTTDVMENSKINKSLSSLDLLKEAMQPIKESNAFSSVGVRKPPANEFGEQPIIVEFYTKDEWYSVSDLLELTTAYLTGHLIANEVFQKTSSGDYLKKVQMLLIDDEKVELFASLLHHWGKVGRWENSPFWV